jgi:hypothetical protein
MDVEINYWAVLVAALASMVVGSIWYSKSVFGRTWAKLAKVNIDRKVSGDEMAWKLIGAFVASLITAYVVAHVGFLSHKFFGNSFVWDAVATSFWLWLGLTATRLYVHDSFESRPLQLTVLNWVHELVTIVVMGLVIGLMGV